MMQPGAAGYGGPPQAPVDPHHNRQQQYQQPLPPQHQNQWMMMPSNHQSQIPLSQPQPPPAGWTPPPIPPPVPIQQYLQPAVAAAVSPGSGGNDEIRSLWIGDLLFWMDENYLANCFAHTGEVVSIKVIRNKQTGQPEGYGFIEFSTRATAEKVLQTYNGTLMPSTEQAFRINWATLGAGERRTDDGADYTIFVGDLSADVNDYLLQETFMANYPSVKGAKVVTDRTTGRSKGYGFVRFADEQEQLRAMSEMNGLFLSNRAMRIGPAATKKAVVGQQFHKASYQATQGVEGESDPYNTTIFVGGLDSNVTEEHLRHVFQPYGELVHVKIPAGKRCGFVQFADRSTAEQALSILNGTVIGGQSVRLSWGRSPTNKQGQADQAQWNGGYYGYPQGYDAAAMAAYGYSAPPQDPSMYYSSYPPAYGNYQQPQQ